MVEALGEEHQPGCVDVFRGAKEVRLPLRAELEVEEGHVRRERRDRERREDRVGEAGGTSPLRMPCHLTSRSSGQPAADSVSCHDPAKLGPVGVAHRDPPEREQPALVDPAALVEEEQMHWQAYVSALVTTWLPAHMPEGQLRSRLQLVRVVLPDSRSHAITDQALLRQLPPRLSQESVLLNAEASDPPALFKVLIADWSRSRDLNLRCKRRYTTLMPAADGLAWSSVRAVFAASIVLLMSVVS